MSIFGPGNDHMSCSTETTLSSDLLVNTNLSACEWLVNSYFSANKDSYGKFNWITN